MVAMARHGSTQRSERPGERDARGGGGAGSADPSATADYIGDLTSQLAGLARAARLDLLAYLLDIARLEASRAADRSAQGKSVSRASMPLAEE